MIPSPDSISPQRQVHSRSAVEIEDRLHFTAGVERKGAQEVSLTLEGLAGSFSFLSIAARRRLLASLNLPEIGTTKVVGATVKFGERDFGCGLRREGRRSRLVWTLPQSEVVVLAELARRSPDSAAAGSTRGSLKDSRHSSTNYEIPASGTSLAKDTRDNALVVPASPNITEEGKALSRPPAGWVALTAKLLSQTFLGDGSVLYDSLCVRVSVPERTSPSEKIIAQNGQQCVFRPTRLGNQIAWAVAENDLDLVGKLFGWEQRIDYLKILDSPELSSAVALLHEDPHLLLHYIQLHHPELNPDQISEVSLHALRGFSGERQEQVDPFEAYSVALKILSLRVGQMEIDLNGDDGQCSIETLEPAIVIAGHADPRAQAIQITGAYSRRIRIDAQGHFEGRVPLPKIGAPNHFLLYAVHDGRQEMSEVAVFAVNQVGAKSDTNEVFLNLVTLKDSARTALLNSTGRQDTLRRAIEVSCLRWFTESEAAGFEELDRKIAGADPERKSMLAAVGEKFRAVAAQQIQLQPGEELLFFQKYTIYEIRRLFAEGRLGVILASEQGTGKTLIAQCLFDRERTTVIAPNAVVSTWIGEERRFSPDPQLVAIEGTYRERDQSLQRLQPPCLVTNIEFLRNSTAARIVGLSRPEGLLVLDEADFIGQRSLQAEGAQRIMAARKLLLSATPFRKPAQVARILHFLEPSDARFSSGRSLARAFPENSPDSLRLLHSLVRAHTIRIRKRDVFRSFDRRLPLAAQVRRLPEKRPMDPALGQYELLPEQCRSIRQLFEHYPSWCEQHRGRETSEDRSYYRFSEGFFSRRESLRQLMNDPRYIGLNLASPKHQRMEQLVRPELKAERSSKVLIFCRYRAQIEAYARIFADLGVCRYFGGLPASSEGYRLNVAGNLIHYRLNSRGEPLLDDRGIPIPVPAGDGSPLRALDYERLVFQNSPHFRVMLATYDSGKVGVTLTAANVVVFDDLASSYPDEYQAGDRAHRIDDRHKKYEVRYYWLTARYPQSFLRSLPEELFENYFAQGTYDQVAYSALRAQEQIFHRIMDGVGSDAELTAIQNRLKLYLPD